MTKLEEVKVEYPDERLKDPQFGSEILGGFKTVSVVPTLPPKNYSDQILFYSSGTTYRIYIYDTTNNVWRYSALT